MGQLTITGSKNPQLTLTDGADSSGLQGLRIGTTDFEAPSSGRLRIEAGSGPWASICGFVFDFEVYFG